MFLKVIWYILGMITEQQKYISSGFKNVGFALLTPFASVIFQWIISPKGAYFEHFWYAVISLILGIISIYIGYKFIEEKK